MQNIKIIKHSHNGWGGVGGMGGLRTHKICGRNSSQISRWL